MKLPALLSALLSTAVLLSACGGSSDGVAPAVEPPAQPPAPPPVIELFAGDIGGHGWGDGTGATARFYRPLDVAGDSVGNTYVADTDNYAIRKVTSAGVVTTIVGGPTSRGTADGPAASAKLLGPTAVAAGRDGSVYFGDGSAVRKLGVDGNVSTVAGNASEPGYTDGPGPGARFGYIADLVADGAGNLYVGAGRTVRRIAADGSVSTLAGSPELGESTDGLGTAAGFAEASYLAFDSSGNLYVTDKFSVRRISPAGQVSTVTPTPSEHWLRSIAVGTDGKIYVGEGGRVSTLDAAGRFQPFVGNASEFGWADGLGATARLTTYGMAAMPDGRLIVADNENRSIRSITAAGQVSTLAGAPALRGHVDAKGAAARFSSAGALATDSNGNVYVADDNVVRKITPDGQVTTLAGKAGIEGTADGTGEAARFRGLAGITVDSSGNVYVTNSANCDGIACEIDYYAINTVRKITPAGVVTTLAGRPGQLGFSDGSGIAASFNIPSGIDVDSEGNIYVADCGNQALRKITPAGTVSTVASSGVGRGGVCNAFVPFRMFRDNGPSGLAVDREGNAYVADAYYHVIRKVTPNGTISVVAGAETQVGATDGKGSEARFYSPRGITIDPSGNLFVTDQSNQVVRKITPEGVVSTFAGRVGETGVLLGPVPGRLSYPNGIDIDSKGTMYVTTSLGVVRIR